MEKNSVPTLRELGYLNERQLAKLLDVVVGTLRNWRNRKIGPPYTRANGDLIVYQLTDVQSWLAARTVKSSKAIPGTISNPRLRRDARP